MALIDIDDAARRRLREIATANRAALDARVRRAAELAEQARDTFEREEADLEAALKRKAQAQAKLSADEEQEAEERPKPRPKPSTLSLGAEEFKLDRQARQATEAAPPTPQQDKPVRKRPPRPESDDDMSGRTWLR